MARRKGSVSYELSVGGSRGWQSIDSEVGGGLIEGLVVGDEETPPLHLAFPFLYFGRMYIISPNTRSCFAMRKGSVSYKLREVRGGVGKALILR